MPHFPFRIVFKKHDLSTMVPNDIVLMNDMKTFPLYVHKNSLLVIIKVNSFKRGYNYKIGNVNNSKMLNTGTNRVNTIAFIKLNIFCLIQRNLFFFETIKNIIELLFCWYNIVYLWTQAWPMDTKQIKCNKLLYFLLLC